MLGGYFDGHPWGQFNAPLVVEDAKFPGMKNFPATFTLFDEIYQIKDFSRQNVRVLLSLDADKLDLTRKGVKRTDKDFAVIWAKNTAKAACSTTASAMFKPSGSVLISEDVA